MAHISIGVYIYKSLCMCVFPIERLHKVFTEYFMIESYVIFFQEG